VTPYVPTTARPVYSAPEVSYEAKSEYEPVQVVLPVYTPSPLPDYYNAGSPDSLPSLPQDNNAANIRNSKDVSTEQPDDLFYIYYKDTEQIPAKTDYARDTQHQHFLGLQGLDIPLYDYDEAADVFRSERDQSSYGLKSESRVSFKQDVGGQKSEFSYTISQ